MLINCALGYVSYGFGAIHYGPAYEIDGPVRVAVAFPPSYVEAGYSCAGIAYLGGINGVPSLRLLTRHVIENLYDISKYGSCPYHLF